MAMTLLGSHVLSLILFTPLAGALLLLVIPRRHEAAIRWIANLFGVTGFVASLPLWFRYQPQGAPWQFVERGRVDSVDRRMRTSLASTASVPCSCS